MFHSFGNVKMAFLAKLLAKNGGFFMAFQRPNGLFFVTPSLIFAGRLPLSSLPFSFICLPLPLLPLSLSLSLCKCCHVGLEANGRWLQTLSERRIDAQSAVRTLRPQTPFFEISNLQTWPLHVAHTHTHMCFNIKTH